MHTTGLPHRTRASAPLPVSLQPASLTPDDNQGFSKERSVRRLPDTQPSPGLSGPEPDSNASADSHALRLDDPQMAINYVPAAFRPPETLVGTPHSHPKLKDDAWLSQYLQQPEGLGEIERLLALRLQREEDHLEFFFPPLLTSLENMQLFVRHIRSGGQFDDPLTPEEDRALALVEKKTASLIEAGVPYKRTVRLAMALMTLCQLITARQVLNPLQDKEPGLFEQRRISSRPLSITPEEVTRLFRTDTPDDPDQKEEDFPPCLGFAVPDLLCNMLNDKSFFVFPSFQALDPLDFCLFGHLPVQPVGLTTDYALNADGIMRSPLDFAKHDIEHIYALRQAGTRQCVATTAAEALLHCPEKRLLWRQLLLDYRPVQLAVWQLKPALTLLLFQLFHEEGPNDAARKLASGKHAFVLCLDLLARARRENRSGYSEHYQAITDTQAAMAALWTVRLWQQWQATSAQPLTPRQVRAGAQGFVATDLPLLEEHLDFLECNRACLRQLFAQRLCRSYQQTGNKRVLSITVPLCPGLWGRHLFDPQLDNSSVRHLDNTDLVYFAASALPELRQQMEEKTGSQVPPAFAFREDPARQS